LSLDRLESLDLAERGLRLGLSYLVSNACSQRLKEQPVYLWAIATILDLHFQGVENARELASSQDLEAKPSDSQFDRSEPCYSRLVITRGLVREVSVLGHCCSRPPSSGNDTPARGEPARIAGRYGLSGPSDGL